MTDELGDPSALSFVDFEHLLSSLISSAVLYSLPHPKRKGGQSSLETLPAPWHLGFVGSAQPCSAHPRVPPGVAVHLSREASVPFGS